MFGGVINFVSISRRAQMERQEVRKDSFFGLGYFGKFCHRLSAEVLLYITKCKEIATTRGRRKDNGAFIFILK